MRTQIIRYSTMLLLVSGIAASGISCKKEDDNTPDNHTTTTGEATKMLQAKEWVMTSWTVTPAYDWNQSGHPANDIFALLPACRKDDIMKLDANGQMIVDEGPSKCGDNDDQHYQRSWLLSEDEKMLVLDAVVFNVQKIEEDKLTLTQERKEDFTTYTHTVVFEAHQ